MQKINNGCTENNQVTPAISEPESGIFTIAGRRITWNHRVFFVLPQEML